MTLNIQTPCITKSIKFCTIEIFFFRKLKMFIKTLHTNINLKWTRKKIPISIKLSYSQILMYVSGCKWTPKHTHTHMHTCINEHTAMVSQRLSGACSAFRMSMMSVASRGNWSSATCTTSSELFTGMYKHAIPLSVIDCSIQSEFLDP